MTYTQFIPYTDRLDYLAPLANNVAYALAVEKLLGIDKQLPPRCQYIRVICCELARISSHLLGLGAFAMDIGALTVFLHTFTEREKIYNLCESLTGARFTTSYTRIGGLSRDLPPGWVEQCRKFLRRSRRQLRRNGNIADAQPHFRGSHAGTSASFRKEDAIDYGLTGPNLRGSGVDYDLAQGASVSGLRPVGIRCSGRLGGRLLRPLSGAHGGNAPERAHSAPMPRQTARRPGERCRT